MENTEDLKSRFVTYAHSGPEGNEMSAVEWNTFCTSMDLSPEKSDEIFHLLLHKSVSDTSTVKLDVFLSELSCLPSQSIDKLNDDSLTAHHTFTFNTNQTENETIVKDIEKLHVLGSRDSISPIEEPPSSPLTALFRRASNGESLEAEGEMKEPTKVTLSSDDKDVDQIVPLLHIDSQKHLQELYQVLHADYPHLLQPFKAIILDFIKDIRSKQLEHESLETVYKRERESNKHQMRQLEEELEEQIQTLEDTVRLEIQEKLQHEYGILIAQKEEALVEMDQRLKQLQKEKLETETRQRLSVSDEGEDDELKKQINTLTGENQTLKVAFHRCEESLFQMRTEMENLRLDMTKKTNDVNQEKKVLIEYLKEQENLTKQLHELNTTNRQLHDVNDDLRSALEIATLTPQSSIPIKRFGKSSPYSSFGYHYNKEDDNMADTETGDSDGQDLSNKVSKVSSNVPSKYYHLARNPIFSEDDDTTQQSPNPDILPTSPEFIEEEDMNQTQDSDSTPAHQRLRSKTLSEFSPDAGWQPLTRRRRRVAKVVSKKRHSLFFNQRSDEEDDEVERRGDAGRIRHYQQNRQQMRWSLADLPTMLFSGGSSEMVTPAMSSDSMSGYRHSASPSTRGGIDALTVMDTPERMYKVVLAGDSGVGKSCYITQLCRQEFAPDMASTLGVDFQTKTLDVDGRLFAIQMWDTAGQERFRSICRSYFRRADGVVVMYDCSNEKSFLNVRGWIDTVQNETQPDIPMIIVGNKTDLREVRREEGYPVVEWAEGWKLAENQNALFIETSAKDNFNVEDALLQLARALRTKEDYDVSTIRMDSVGGTKPADKKSKFASCCSK